MARLIYQIGDDNNVDDAAIVTPSTEDPDYPVDNLWDSDPANPFKMTDPNGNIVWDFGTATTIDLVALIHHNIAPTADVRIQANATNVWTSPTLNQVITIPAAEGDGYPVSPFKDLTALSRSFRYWRLVVSGNSGDDLSIGEMWMSQPKKSLVHNYSWGYELGLEKGIIEHKTDYESSAIYDLGYKIKTLDGEIQTSDAGLAAIKDWWEQCRGRALPTLIIPDPDVNEALLVRWTVPSIKWRRDFTNNVLVNVGWREVSRGLRP
jgi:hypothetical protein